MRIKHSVSLLGALALCAVSAHAEDRWVTETRCSEKVSVGNWFFVSIVNPSRTRATPIHSDSCLRLNDSTLAGTTPAERSSPPRFGISAYHKGLSLVLNVRF
jgi:hypothetical protein